MTSSLRYSIGVKPTSLQWPRYCSKNCSGMRLLTTFVILISAFDESSNVFSPKGRSCIIYVSACYKCQEMIELLRGNTRHPRAFNGRNFLEPRPWINRWCLAMLKRYLVKLSIHLWKSLKVICLWWARSVCECSSESPCYNIWLDIPSGMSR